MVNRERQPHLAHLTVAKLPTDPLMRSVTRHDGHTNWITAMTFSQGMLSRSTTIDCELDASNLYQRVARFNSKHSGNDDEAEAGSFSSFSRGFLQPILRKFPRSGSRLNGSKRHARHCRSRCFV